MRTTCAALAIILMSMIGLQNHVEYSGWVLTIGLLMAFSQVEM